MLDFLVLCFLLLKGKCKGKRSQASQEPMGERRYNYGSPLYCGSSALRRGTLCKTVEVKLVIEGLIRKR